MKKEHVSWIGFLPIALITIMLASDTDTNKYTGKICLSILISLTVIVLLYFMLEHMKIKKWVAITIALILWVIAIIVKKQFL